MGTIFYYDLPYRFVVSPDFAQFLKDYGWEKPTVFKYTNVRMLSSRGGRVADLRLSSDDTGGDFLYAPSFEELCLPRYIESDRKQWMLMISPQGGWKIEYIDGDFRGGIRCFICKPGVGEDRWLSNAGASMWCWLKDKKLLKI